MNLVTQPIPESESNVFFQIDCEAAWILALGTFEMPGGVGFGSLNQYQQHKLNQYQLDKLDQYQEDKLQQDKLELEG